MSRGSNHLSARGVKNKFLSGMSNKDEFEDRGQSLQAYLCPKCGKELGKGVTRCWTRGCDYVIGAMPTLESRQTVPVVKPEQLPGQEKTPGESGDSAGADGGSMSAEAPPKKDTPHGGCMALIAIVVGVVLCAFFSLVWVARGIDFLSKGQYKESFFPYNFIIPIMCLGVVLLGAAGALFCAGIVIHGFCELLKAIVPNTQLESPPSQLPFRPTAAAGTLKGRRLEELPAGEVALYTVSPASEKMFFSVGDFVRALACGEIDPTDEVRCRDSNRVSTAGAVREAALLGGQPSVRKLFGL